MIYNMGSARKNNIVFNIALNIAILIFSLQAMFHLFQDGQKFCLVFGNAIMIIFPETGHYCFQLFLGEPNIN